MGLLFVTGVCVGPVFFTRAKARQEIYWKVEIFVLARIGVFWTK